MRVLVMLLLVGCGDQGIKAKDTAPEAPVSEFGDPDALTGPSTAVFSDNEALYLLYLSDGGVREVGRQTAFNLCLSPDRSLAAWGDRHAYVTALEQQDGKLIDELEAIDRPIGFIDDETLLFHDDGLMSHDGLNITWVRGENAGYGTYFFDDLPEGYRLELSHRPMSPDGAQVVFSAGDDSRWRIHAADTASFPNFGYDYHDLESYTVDDELRGCVPLWHPDGGVVCATETDVVWLDEDLDRRLQLTPPGGIKDAEVAPVGGGIIYRDDDNHLLMKADFASGEVTRFKAWDELNNVSLATMAPSSDGSTVIFASDRGIYRGTVDGANLFRVRGITSPVRSLTW